MAVTFIDWNHANFLDGAEVVIGLPPSTAAGDVIVAAMSSHIDTITPTWGENGWTLRFESSAAGSQVWTRTVTADDVSRGTYTVTIAGDPGVLVLATFRGGTAAWVAGTTNSYVAPSVTGAAGDAVRIWLFGRTGTTPTTTNPAGVTERARYGDTNAGIVICDAASATVTGSKTATKSGTTAFTHISGVTVLIGANRVPYPPAWLSPANGTVLRRDVANRFAWQFSDPDPGDTQSAFDVRRMPSGGAWDAGDHIVSPASYWDADAGSLPVGDVQVQVRTYDRLGAVGQWSPSLFVTGADPIDAPTITHPADGGTVAQSDRVDWSYPTQTSYQVRRVGDAVDGTADTGTVYFDTGEVVDTDTRTLALSFDTNNRYEHIEVRVKNSGLWSDWVDVRVLVSYATPPVPALSVFEGDDGASMVLAVATAAPGEGQPAATSLDLYVSTDGGTTALRCARGLPITGSATYWLPASGVDHVFQAVTTADNGAASASPWMALLNIPAADAV